MATSRFPNAKYIRQLRAMHNELAFWRASYLDAARQTTSLHLAGRFAGRAAVLEDAIYEVAKLTDTLYGLPRIS